MTAMPDQAVAYEAPAFDVAQSLRDPRREAAELADRRRDAGFDEGFRRGWAAAEADVQATVDDHRRSAERLASCSTAFEHAHTELTRRDAVVLQDIERDVMTLAVVLAAEIIGRELEATDAPLLDSLSRVVQLLPDRGTPILRVNPADAETALEAVAADVVTWTRDVEVVGDPNVEVGGCVVDIGSCRIDGQVRTAIERLRCQIG